MKIKIGKLSNWIRNEKNILTFGRRKCYRFRSTTMSRILAVALERKMYKFKIIKKHSDIRSRDWIMKRDQKGLELMLIKYIVNQTTSEIINGWEKSIRMENFSCCNGKEDLLVAKVSICNERNMNQFCGWIIWKLHPLLNYSVYPWCFKTRLSMMWIVIKWLMKQK
jgi:hypothetical protein